MADFIATLAELKNGRVSIQAGEAFQELIAAVHKTAGKGKLTFELTAAPARVEDGEVKEVDIGYSLKVTKPTPNHGATMFYLTKDQQLTRNDPAQMEMFNQEVRRQ